MKHFLADVLTFLAIQALLLAGLQGLYQRCLGNDHYLAAFRDKERRLARTAPPRVLLVGGSSFAFGVNSRAIERALERPAVNLGLNAGLGLELIVRQAEEALGPGDLVILAPEYNLLGPSSTADPRLLLQLLSVAPSSARFVSAREIPGLLDDGLCVVSTRLHALKGMALYGPPNGVYRRASFDERGDVVAHHGLPSQQGRGEQLGGLPSDAELSLACERLKLLAERARARGARVVLAPAPVPSDALAREAGRIAGLWSSVVAGTGIPLLEADRAYPRSLFFDTAYHLTLEGKRLRTQSLLAALPTALARPGP